MYAPERQHTIVEMAQEAGRIDVHTAAERLGVTPETVRRDLRALERRGLIRRVHGGALPIERHELEPTLGTRLGHANAAKRRIGARAIEELPEHGTILLDAGTTTLAIAEELPRDRELTVVTNSVSIAALLHTRESVALYLLGGRIRPRTGAGVGEWVTRSLAQMAIDVAFIGTNGFSLDRGLTTPDQAEAAAKSAMVAAGRRIIVATDSTKAGRDHLHRFCSLDDVDMILTDSGLDDETAEALDALGMDVVRT